MNRRDFIRGIIAGGVVVAGELWVPGQKLISIPSGKVFSRYIEFTQGDESYFVEIDANGCSIAELYEAVCRYFDNSEMMPLSMPLLPDTPNLMNLHNDWSITDESYQHLHSGAILERRTGAIWSDCLHLGPEEPLEMV